MPFRVGDDGIVVLPKYITKKQKVKRRCRNNEKKDG
jgi:hypothetical protein